MPLTPSTLKTTKTPPMSMINMLQRMMVFFLLNFFRFRKMKTWLQAWKQMSESWFRKTFEVPTS